MSAPPASSQPPSYLQLAVVLVLVRFRLELCFNEERNHVNELEAWEEHLPCGPGPLVLLLLESWTLTGIILTVFGPMLTCPSRALDYVPSTMLDSTLLVACIGIVIALILHFFYWNRLFAYSLSQILRLFWWTHDAERAWVEIGSVHFSLLAGRIAFKDLKYHTSCQTIKVVKGQLTWRYWIRKAAMEEDISYVRVGGEPQQSALHARPCRVQISLQGLEYYLHNRTASYDNIFSELAGSQNPAPPPPTEKFVQQAGSGSPPASVSGVPLVVKQTIAWIRSQLPSVDIKEIFPIGVEFHKGALVYGNQSTAHLLAIEFHKAEGTYGYVQPRSKHDDHKKLLNLKFQHVLARYIPHDDYEGSIYSRGEVINEFIDVSRADTEPLRWCSFHSFAGIWKQFRKAPLYDEYRRRKDERVPHKTDLSEKTEDTPMGIDFSAFEYAIEYKLLETPMLDLSYYFDAPGEVPPLSEIQTPVLESIDVGNGDVSPEWGIDLVIWGGFLHYGPWADRQRAELQRTFFPSSYQNVTPQQRRQPGDSRLWTSFKTFIEFRDNTTLHIPFREASKNWQWDGLVDVPRPRKREPASIQITVADRSSVCYHMPTVAGPTGYEPFLEVHLDSVAVASSLNDIRLINAQSCRIRCELSSPLKWDADRTWPFAVSLHHPVLYLLRDHINMLIDLGKDWTSGPPADHARFIPVLYLFRLEMHYFELNLYANDHNIIDKPLVKDENALLTFRGPRFYHETKIPANEFRPEATRVPFVIEISDPTFYLSLPRWNTNALYAPAGGNHLGKAESFQVAGFYRYFAEVREEHVENLTINVTVRDLAFKALGWSVRYFMALRENYFASFTQFSTLNEYLDRSRRGLPTGDPIAQKYRPGKANVLQVDFGISFCSALLILPAGLSGYEASNLEQAGENIGACVIVTLPEVQVQIRLHDYFMEMSMNFRSASGYIESNGPEKAEIGRFHPKTNATFLIDCIDITADRLLGPQPRTATFVCVWMIHLGPIRALLSAYDGQILQAALRAFPFNFTDSPNAPAAQYSIPLDPDVTFVKVSLDAIDVTWLAGPAAVEISIPQGLCYEKNDLGGKLYRKLSSLRLPYFCVKMYHNTAGRHRQWLETAEFTGDAFVDIYSPGWEDEARMQNAFVKVQSAPTGRAKHMFEAFIRDQRPSDRLLHKNGLYLPQPRLSNPEVRRRQRSRTNAPGHGDERPGVKSRRRSEVSHFTESEAESSVSQPQRDSHVTRSRTTTSAFSSPVDDENQSMSSGDESDDEDLTDADSSDSDGSDVLNDPPDNADRSTLKSYSRCTRHYTAPSLKDPSLWDGSPFLLTRDLRPFTQPLGPPDLTSQPTKRPILSRPGNILPSAVFRVESRRGLEVHLTPLIVTAASQLLKTLEANMPSAELTLDAILTDHVTNLSASKDARRGTTFDVLVSSARICVLCRLPTATTERGFILPAFKDVGPDPDGIMVPLSLFIDGTRLTLKHSSSPVESTFSAVVNNACVVVGPPYDTALTSHSATLKPRPFRVDVVRLRTDYGLGNLEVVCDAISAEVDHAGPDLVLLIGLLLFESSRELLRSSTAFTHRRAARKQRVLSSILQSSESRTIVDPSSTIQPSYLVQVGLPHRLRTDNAFRFLYHLRNCLWHLEESGRQAWAQLLRCDTKLVADDIESLLESRLKKLSLNTDVTTAILNTLFSNSQVPDAHRDAVHSTRFLQSALLRVEKANLAVVNSSSISLSQFTVTGLQVFVCHGNSKEDRALRLQTALSRTSLPGAEAEAARRLVASVSLKEINIIISPHLMRFTQQVLRVYRNYLDHSSLSRANGRKDPTVYASTPLSLEFMFSLHRFRMQAAAENLIFEFGIAGMQLISTITTKSGNILQIRQAVSINLSALFDDASLRALSPRHRDEHNDHDVLAKVACGGGKLNSSLNPESPLSQVLQITVSLESVRLSVPRSALRLYRFIEEWRVDFLPGMEAMLKELMSEVHNSPARNINPGSRATTRPLGYQVQGSIAKLGVSLQIMPRTWLAWDIYQVITYLDPSNFHPRNAIRDFGVQLASQSFSIFSKPGSSTDAQPSPRLKLDLPTLSVTGHYDGSRIRTMGMVEFLQFKVKPSHWDTLLVVQQKFGQDFHDLMGLVEETRRHRAATKTPPSSTHPQRSWKLLSGSLKMRGFRVGLEGISSTLYLDCRDIRGRVDPDAPRPWHVRFSGLGLSLAPYGAGLPRALVSSQTHRSAFVVIDFHAGSGSETAGSHALEVVVNKIHAIMQPSSIAEVGDFIDHMQAEILKRQEQRAIELADFREKTRSVLRTFEINLKEVQRQESSSLLSEYTIKLSIKNIGVAFPLTLDQDLRLPSKGSPDSNAVRAFLFSIKSLDFGSHRGERGQAVMHDFSFQFVSRFRQSVSADFSGPNHHTRNRLVYPEMTAYIRSHASATSRRVWIEANVSGFILDLAPTIPDYVFSLIDVYRQGKDRVTRLTTNVPRKASTTQISPQTQASATGTEQQYTTLPTSSVVASLTFLSGKVRMHSGPASASTSRQAALHEVLDDQFWDFEGETFELPIISLWGEYYANPASVGKSAEPSILTFRSTVHSSQNILRPGLLPFLTELVNHIETQMREDSWRQLPPPANEAPPRTSDDPEPDPVATMQISFSLRIDQSKLELTCQPDVNVVAGLHWDSGGFVVNVSPGASKITISGCVGGLTVGLKHGFLSEDCLRLDARNLAFSVALGKLGAGVSQPISTILVAVDTEFSGAVRFSRLQDVLCFKAVWLDRIPIFAGPDTDIAQPSQKAVVQSAQTTTINTDSATACLVRIRQIKLDIDLGQSISAVVLELQDTLLRTKVTTTSNEVSLSVTNAVILAKGNLSGSADVPNFMFQTIRGTEGQFITSGGRPRLLELTMTSGALSVLLESEHQKLVQYRAEPLKVEIFDDWPLDSPDTRVGNQPLRLSFAVNGSEVTAAVTIRTIPMLLFYANKFKANLVAQRDGASRESRAFRSTQSPGPDNPLSAVANAMLQSRFKEAEIGLSYLIQQQMSLRLRQLRLAGFPRSMADLEMAQFVGIDVRARLDRLVEPDGRTTQRDLHLSFTSMVISKYSQLNHSRTGISSPSDAKVWLTILLKDAQQAIIVGLPHMHMHMVSEQTAGNSNQVLAYDFNSQFIRSEGLKDQENIYITLNMSLYSWLTLLRRNLSRELIQVKTSGDWRTAIGQWSPRKKIPEPLGESTSPLSGQASGSWSPMFLSPGPVIRSHSMDQAKSASAAYSSFEARGKDMYMHAEHHSKSTDTLPSTPNPVSMHATMSTSPEEMWSPPLASSSKMPDQKEKTPNIVYQPHKRHIDRLTMRQLGEATPDVMHPFFMKKAGFNLEDALPQYVHEYATLPLEEIMEALLRLYSNQLRRGKERTRNES